MYSRLVSWSRWLYLAGIVLVLVLITPTTWFPFQLGKVAVFVTLLTAVMLMYVLGRGVPDLLRTHGLKLALLAALLPASYLVSTFFSTDRAVALIGYGFATDTILFTSLAFLAYLLSFTLFRTLRTARRLLMVVFWALVAAVVFQWVMVVFGTDVLPFPILTDRSANLIGKWNDLSLMVGLLGVLLLTWGELARTTFIKRIVGIGFLALVALLLGVINFSLVWGMVLGFSIALGLVVFFVRRSQESLSQEVVPASVPSTQIGRAPWFAVAGVVVSLLFLFFGGALNTRLTNLFPVSSLEVRPSYTSTLDIINKTRSTPLQLLVGTGPNTFGEYWLLNKPPGVNQTQFWSLDFNVGFSTVLTALGSVGLFGVLAWLIPLILVLVGFLRAVRLGVLSREERLVAVQMTLASIFLVTAAIFYVPSQNILFLTFVLSGATFGFLWRQGRSAPPQEGARSSLVGAALIAILLLSLGLWGGYVTDRRFVAQAKVGVAAEALTQGNIDEALAKARSAFATDKKATDSLRLTVRAGLAKMQALAATTEPNANIQQEFATVVQQTITAGNVAASSTPRDYRPLFMLGNVYEFLASLGIEGAYESGRSALQDAAALNPTNPAIALALARLEAGRGNLELAQEHITRALTLKPDYTDAILFVVQLDVANNDIPSAVQAALAAAQTAPGVAPIWFQLGLLFYVENDTVNAIPAFEQALNIVPDYANAKYFLGLSYYIQGRTQEAIQQFEDLQTTNPGNSEVELILSNLAQGNEPFANANPPLPPPEERETAPIAQ